MKKTLVLICLNAHRSGFPAPRQGGWHHHPRPQAVRPDALSGAQSRMEQLAIRYHHVTVTIQTRWR